MRLQPWTVRGATRRGPDPPWPNQTKLAPHAAEIVYDGCDKVSRNLDGRRRRRATKESVAAGVEHGVKDADRNASTSMYTAWSHLSDLSKRLLLVGTGLMMMAAAALGLMLWWLHRNALLESRDNMTALGTAISEQTSRSLQAGDLVLEDLRRQIGNQRVARARHGIEQGRLADVRAAD